MVFSWRMIERAGHVEHVGEVRSECNVLDVKPDGNRLSGRPGHRREDNHLRRILQKQNLML